jgi:hypothetical protein
MHQEPVNGTALSYDLRLTLVTAMQFNHDRSYTGIQADDRRINRELQAMGAFDTPSQENLSLLGRMLESIGEFFTWMRWKGEIATNGCRLGADYARALEKVAAKV